MHGKVEIWLPFISCTGRDTDGEFLKVAGSIVNTENLIKYNELKTPEQDQIPQQQRTHRQ